MPGFNQRGPMNEGPMTGKGLGRCAARNQNVGGTPDAANAPGFGRGRGMAMGRGRCRRTWWGADAAGDTRVSRQIQPVGEEALTLRVHQLERELETIKNLLNRVDKQ
jgi:hypothetical protein